MALLSKIALEMVATRQAIYERLGYDRAIDNLADAIEMAWANITQNPLCGDTILRPYKDMILPPEVPPVRWQDIRPSKRDRKLQYWIAHTVTPLAIAFIFKGSDHIPGFFSHPQSSDDDELTDS